MEEIWVDSHHCCISIPGEVPVANLEEGDLSTEADTKRHRRLGSARITRLLVQLTQGASASIDFSSRERSWTILDQTFDDGMYQLNWG